VFTELMPLLAERTVLITIARESDTTIRVNVCPKRTAESENAALSTPLSFVGTPEELDRDFAKELAAYVDTHRQLGSTLAEAKAAMEAAARAAQEEAKRKADEKRKAKPSASTPAPSDCTQPTAVVNPDPAPAGASLFGGASAEPAESKQQQQQQEEGGGGLRL
jgi:PRTRC genetic system protein E